MEKTLLDTVTLSSGTLAQSPVARQPFMGKLMSVAPLAGSLWMLRTVAGSGVGGGERQQRQTKGEKDRAVSGSGASALGREVGWDHHGAAPGSGQVRCTWGLCGDLNLRGAEWLRYWGLWGVLVLVIISPLGGASHGLSCSCLVAQL